MDQVDDQEHHARAERRARLQKHAAELTRKQSNAEHQLVLDQIAELEHHDQQAPATATAEDLNLVGLLPHLAVNLHRAPVELQALLYELTKLRVHLDHETDHAMIDITPPATGLTTSLRSPQEQAITRQSSDSQNRRSNLV